MLLRISQLASLDNIDKIIIHSIDQSLYQASIALGDDEFYLADNEGQLLRTFSLSSMQEKLGRFPCQKRVLRHESAYDEMIGQDDKNPGQNRLEVELQDVTPGTTTQKNT